MMDYRNAIVWAASGNPGCAAFLCDLYSPDLLDLDMVINVMTRYPELRGSNGYMIWNDACDRDTKKACEVFWAILHGRLPIETVRAHLAEGFCAPFRPEEYVGGTKA